MDGLPRDLAAPAAPIPSDGSDDPRRATGCAR